MIFSLFWVAIIAVILAAGLIAFAVHKDRGG